MVQNQEQHVLEVGPGVGTLTSALLRRNAKVTAIEKDPNMVEVLKKEITSDALFVVQGDATLLEPKRWFDKSIVLTGNLPYALTGPILRRITERRESIHRAVIMVQREVAHRLSASPATNTYGALTVFVSNHYEVNFLFSVSASSFFPRPKVESAVIQLVRRATPRTPESDVFRQVVHAVFQQRRKIIRNALRAYFATERIDAALKAEHIAPQVRGETLSVEELGRLAAKLETKQ